MGGNAYAAAMALVLALRSAWAGEAPAMQEMSECSGDDAECLASLTNESTHLNVHLMQKKLEHHRNPSAKNSKLPDETTKDKDEKLDLRTYLAKNAMIENQSLVDDLVKKHAQAWKLHQINLTSTEAATLSSTTSSLLPLKYQGQYFKPKTNMCGGSFTGLGYCTLHFCNDVVFFYSLSIAGSSCKQGVFYSNAASRSDGYGMCRCFPNSASALSRYTSGSGNNIYTDLSWV